MKSIISLLILLLGIVGLSSAADQYTFAIWHCGDDGCTWGYEPDLNNSSSWIANRGDGNPTFNLVIFSFVDPLILLQGTTDDNNINGVPRGMTQQTVNWFTSKGIQVMISIGGASLAGNWDQALQQDAVTLAKNAAAISQNLNVGIEIDYENENDDTDNLLDTFVSTYRSIIPYDESNQAATLTVDLGGGLGWLDDLSAHASKWLSNGQLNWENEMVDYYNTIDEATANWTTHLNGQDGVPPVPGNQMGVSIFENEACQNYDGSVTQQAIPWIKQQGIRGLFFWAQGSDVSASSLNMVGDQDCPGLRQASYDMLGGGNSTSGGR